MSESAEITIDRSWWTWEITERLLVIRNAPVVFDPETGKNIDPVTGSLVFRWCGEGWVLVYASVNGMEIDEEGHHPGEEMIEVEFLDPLSSDEGFGAPGWLLKEADERKALLPDMSGLEKQT